MPILLLNVVNSNALVVMYNVQCIMYSKSLNSDQTTSRLITYNDYRAKYNLAFLEKSYQTIKFYNRGGGSNDYQRRLKGTENHGDSG